ncbi:hypothetical protein HN836_00250, partial [Candidatus Woesearchaeota archaeon]|nr:hypothetical protein [Candidatus Woesearchaeota archaeon]
MKEKIKALCKDIEKKYNIKILFAIENGSRAWRMHSMDSDYDIRFVFIRPVDNYLKINSEKDVINICFDKNFKDCKPEGALIDISGFDIFKFFSLLHKSNPTTIEWLISDIVYHGKQIKSLVDYAKNKFNQATLFYHYQSLCKKNYLGYLKSNKMRTHKKYLYTYRGLINALWVKEKNSIPPIKFVKAIDGVKDYLPKLIINKLKEIIKLKSQGKEKDLVDKSFPLDQFAEQFLKKEYKFEKKDSEVLKNNLD